MVSSQSLRFERRVVGHIQPQSFFGIRRLGVNDSLFVEQADFVDSLTGYGYGLQVVVCLFQCVFRLINVFYTVLQSQLYVMHFSSTMLTNSLAEELFLASILSLKWVMV